jgi:hypothetical protein
VVHVQQAPLQVLALVLGISADNTAFDNIGLRVTSSTISTVLPVFVLLYQKPVFQGHCYLCGALICNSKIRKCYKVEQVVHIVVKRHQAVQDKHWISVVVRSRWPVALVVRQRGLRVLHL